MEKSLIKDISCGMNMKYKQQNLTQTHKRLRKRHAICKSKYGSTKFS